MGNSKQPVEKKRRKKGRPSLLDLQKRSLRLQKQQQQQQQQPNPNPNPSPSPSPNPYLRFPATRRSSAPDADSDSDSDSGARREKKLNLVLADHDNKSERWNSSKATEGHQGEASGSGAGPAATPLPDPMLLVFILDRLQKKDTYGVFSEPVDPDELPDYHEKIEHPMDFGTVRKKLASGEYADLEEFEKDVFLISSNAMRYNSSDTIYYRQARAIQELAKKDFENLRQESDDNEPEPKTAPRRGRPPSKNTSKRPEHATSDFSDAMLANVSDNELSRKRPALDKPGVTGISTRSSVALRNTKAVSWMGEQKTEKKEEYSGFVPKRTSGRYGKKPSVIDENRRDTYLQYQPSISARELPLLAAFDGEGKQLVPVGLQMEHAYARSLARFAANLGPVGWEIAAKKIESVLPPGTKFGRGWVGESEAPQQSQPLFPSTTLPRFSSLPKTTACSSVYIDDQPLQKRETPTGSVEEGQSSRAVYHAVSPGAYKSPDSAECPGPSIGLDYEAGSNLFGGVGSSSQSKASLQLQQIPGMQPTTNGFNTQFGFNFSSQLATMVRPQSGSFNLETPMTHGRALDMVSRGNSIYQRPMPQLDAGIEKMEESSSKINFGAPTTDPNLDLQKRWRGLNLQQKTESDPPDLNSQFQSPGPGSPAAGLMVDPKQQPDLALQL